MATTLTVASKERSRQLFCVKEIDMRARELSGAPRRRAPDPQGQAALLLAESILHGLIEKGVLSVDDALAITTVAIDAKEEVIREHGEPREIGRQSVRLLSRIAASLTIDGRC